MNNRLRLTASVVVTASLAVGVGAGCAGKSMSKTGAGDIVAERQRIMRLQGANVGDMVAKLRAGNIEAIAVNAETLAILGTRIPDFFPEGSINDKSNALPEIWSKWAEFEAAAKNLTTRSEELRNAARAKDQPKVEAMMKDFAQADMRRLPRARSREVPQAVASAVTANHLGAAGGIRSDAGLNPPAVSWDESTLTTSDGGGT